MRSLGWLIRKFAVWMAGIYVVERAIHEHQELFVCQLDASCCARTAYLIQTVLELRQMYATLELPDHTPLEDDDLPDGELLTSTCGGLLLVEGEAQTVRVVHYTAQEYFERTHVQELEAARLRYNLTVQLSGSRHQC